MVIHAKAKEMKARGISLIDLSAGEADFPTPVNVKIAAKNSIDRNLTKYTINAGLHQLRIAIAHKLKKENNLTFRPEEIIVSTGAKQGVFNAVLSLVDSGDEVLIPSPYWVSYPQIVKIAGGRPKFIKTPESNNFKLTPKLLGRAITKSTKVLILCNPNNPTGSVYTREELESLAEIINWKKMYVIIDEVYEKLVYDGFRFASLASIDESIKNRTVTVNGVSKAYAMTGWRIGYAAGPAVIINAMNKIQGHSTSNASTISQHAALEALTGSQEEVDKMRLEFEVRRNYFYKALNSINGIKCNKPQGAFFVMPNIKELISSATKKNKPKNSFDITMNLLDKYNLVTVHGSAFGAEGYLRITYTASMRKLMEAVKIIETAAGKL